jgi:glycosyltransferase involved in cell wall biosynthesis
MAEDVTVVIPAYNEERTVAGVIRGLKVRQFTHIIVVDDGSTDKTADLARQENVVLLQHVLNRGLGGALRTGIKGALRFQPKIIVTFDADGQHDPDDIGQLIKPIEKGDADVVIGSRTMDTTGMPPVRRLANWIANLVTYLLFGIWTTDSQSGLRAFNRKAAAQIDLMTSGMEGSSEILAEVAEKRLRYVEAPVRAIYTDYSLSKGQNFKLGVLTLMKLILVKAQRLAQ